MTRSPITRLVTSTFLFALAGASPALAQCALCPPGGGGGFDNIDPTIELGAAHVWVTSSAVSPTIQYYDNVELAGAQIKLNGTSVYSQFTVTYSGSPPTSATANGSISLSPGSNTLWTRICDGSSNCATETKDYTYDNANPTVGVSPSTSYTISSSRSVTINWGDNLSLNAASRVIKLNGSSVKSSFGWSGGGTSATSSGTVSLSPGSNTFYAKICDQAGRCKSKTVTYTYDNANPGVQISPGSSTISSASTSATITWSDNLGLNAGSRVIELNGVNVRNAFSWSGGGTSATSTDNISLVPGENTLYAYIEDTAGREDSKTVTYTRPHTYTVSVTPQAGADSTPAGENDSFTFTVHNQGNSTASYTLEATCTGSGWTGACSPAQSSVNVGAGSSKTVAVNFGTAFGHPGLAVNLEASGHGVSDVGAVSIKLTYPEGDPAAPVIASVDPMDEAIDRSSCLTMALADAAAASCGDLRIVHGLPAMRAMNKTFAPTLVYSAAATGTAMVNMGAEVTLPAGAAVPDSVTAELSVNGSAFQKRKWSASHFVPGATLRLVAQRSTNATGLLPYELRVTNWYGSAPHATATTGALIHVSRHASAFGSGWWLAGLESLMYVGQSRMLWIGGDGSARVYDVTSDPAVWRGANRARPDSIVKVGTQYVRIAPGRVEVRFDGSGRHVETRDRNGIKTAFSYVSGRLDRITLPTPGASSRYYQFDYSAGKLSSVDAHGRTTDVVIASDRIEAVTDPDGTVTTFEYPSASSRLIRFRDVQGGTRTEFLLNGARHVRFVRRYLDAAPHIESTLRHQESQGLDDSGIYEPVRVAQAHTWIDGPRTDVGDTTLYYLNPHSEPDSIRDPLGGWTRLRRADPAWPGLVTRVSKPGGQIVSATYDPRGRLVESADSNSYPQVAKTTYLWDDGCDMVERVTRPEGDFTAYTYTSSCNIETQRDNRGASSEVTYSYYADGRLESVDPPEESPTTLYYDAGLGNLTRVEDPLDNSTHYHGDAWGRDTLVITPVTDTTSQRVSTFYDAMGRDTLTVTIGDPTSYSWTSPSIRNVTLEADTMEVWRSYDAEGNLLTTDRVVTAITMLGYGEMRRRLSTFRYDRANRRVYSSEAGASDSTVYDPAGNPTLKINRMGTHITMQYDPANRLTQRVSEAVDYPYECLAESMDLCQFYYWPYYPNDGNDLRIPADTAIFDYDADGNMTVAANGAAKIGRVYHPNGLLKEDTLRIRAYEDDSDFSSHVYVLTYAYDLNGRPTAMTYPSQLNVGTVDYSYHPWGPLETVTGTTRASTHSFYFSYDGQNRLTATHYPGGGRDTVTYDALGRVHTRLNTTPSRGTIHNDVFTRDLLGRVTHANTAKGEVDNWYSAVGPLVATNWYDGNSWERNTEEFTVDPAGLLSESRRQVRSGEGMPHLTTHIRASNSRVIEMRVEEENEPMADETTTAFSYYTGGAVKLKHTLTLDPNGSSQYRQTDRSWYDGLERLAAYQRNDQTYEDPFVSKGVFEEYRYDALGRRVLLRSRKEGLSNEQGKISYIERFVWAGDQLIGEFRAKGGNSVSTATLESDNETGDDYGRVGYVHAGGIDRPISIFRGGHSYVSGYVVPHANWRGMFDTGTKFDGDWAECPDGTTTTCPVIMWPGDYRGAYGDSRNGERGDWMGSLARDMTDASGLSYRRNRYYDPVTGEFTQVDPIGIAGGLNLYGYANGDPVTFSDPFGLSATCIPCAAPLVLKGGAVLGAGAATVAATQTPGFAEGAERLGTFIQGNVRTATALGNVVITNAADRLTNDLANVAFGAEDLLRWGRKKAVQIGLAIGQALAGHEGSTKAAEERLRQQQAQEQLEEEQKPDPSGGH